MTQKWGLQALRAGAVHTPETEGRSRGGGAGAWGHSTPWGEEPDRAGGCPSPPVTKIATSVYLCCRGLVPHQEQIKDLPTGSGGFRTPACHPGFFPWGVRHQLSDCLPVPRSWDPVTKLHRPGSCSRTHLLSRPWSPALPDQVWESWLLVGL